jgi:hypothetical protein
MLRFCVSWRVPRLSFLPITLIGRFVFFLRGTVLMFRYPSNDFDRRVAGGFLAVGEWKSFVESIVVVLPQERRGGI